MNYTCGKRPSISINECYDGLDTHCHLQRDGASGADNGAGKI